METLEEQIADVEARSRLLDSEMRELRERLRALQLSKAARDFNVTVGSLVTHKGRLFRVTSVDVRFSSGKPWVTANPKKKDGTFGVARRTLYTNWEVVNVDA